MGAKYLTAVMFTTLAYCGITSAAIETKPTDYQQMVKSDNELSDRIGQGLLDDARLPRSAWENIGFKVKNGAVSFTGEVATAEQKQLILEVAKKSGAKKVSEFLTITEELEQQSPYRND